MSLVTHRFVNGVQGDPCLFSHFIRSGEAILCDLGTLEPLPQKDLMKVHRAFVSHCHVDHFVGFDRLLRVNIPHRRPLELYGPAGLAKCVQGKLRGYTWNLVTPGQIQFKVMEVIATNTARTFQLVNDDGFTLHEMESSVHPSSKMNEGSPRPIAVLDDGTSGFAAPMDHGGIPSIAYCFRSRPQFRVNTAALDSLGVVPGPWIKHLQETLSADPNSTAWIDFGNGTGENAQALRDRLLIPLPPEGFGYATDLSFTRKNVEQAAELFQDVPQLMIESSFLDIHADRAARKAHLTSRQAAAIAVLARASEIIPFHISNIYGPEYLQVVDEALDFARTLSPSAVQAFVQGLPPS